METVRPGQWLVLLGGALLFAFSFMDAIETFDGETATSWEDFGLSTWPPLLGLLCALVAAAVVFGKAEMRNDILTFSVPQLLVIAAFTAALIVVGRLVLCLLSDVVDPAAGLWLSGAAALGLLAGTVMEQQAGPVSNPSASTPPSAF